jgi:hypothetical protein
VPSPFSLISSSAILVWLQALSKLPLRCPPPRGIYSDVTLPYF